jgi:hypothetical protein
MTKRSPADGVKSGRKTQIAIYTSYKMLTAWRAAGSWYRLTAFVAVVSAM